jgi:hypothetical protein
MQGVAVTVSPETIQDAVSVTKALGLRYLWVDCLCIVQDVVEDWAAALANMDNIYGSSTITIAAPSYPDAHAGFLKSRLFTGPCLKLPFQSPFMAEQGLLWIQRRDRLTVQQRLSAHWKQPLQQLAWALQERFLSSRTVFFDDFERAWECHGGRYREGTNPFLQVTELESPLSTRKPNPGRDCGNAGGPFRYTVPKAA